MQSNSWKRVQASVWTHRLACVLAGLVLSRAAVAAQPLVLTATATSAKEPLVLRVASVGVGGVTLPRAWPASNEVSWLFVRVSGTQENRDASTVGQADADGGLRIMPGAGGAALVGVDLVMREEEWTAAEANRFASQVGQDKLCFDDSVRVWHAISAAAVVNVPPDAADLASNHAAMSKSGLATEIRPLMDPLSIQGGDCAFRVYVGGDAVPGAMVRGVHIRSGAVQMARADGKGIAVFRMDEPGDWRIEFDTLLARDDVWQATSSTLTFRARGKDEIKQRPQAGAEPKPIDVAQGQEERP